MLFTKSHEYLSLLANLRNYKNYFLSVQPQKQENAEPATHTSISPSGEQNTYDLVQRHASFLQPSQ